MFGYRQSFGEQDGIVMYGGTECIVNEMKDGEITDFKIVGIGLNKKGI